MPTPKSAKLFQLDEAAARYFLSITEPDHTFTISQAELARKLATSPGSARSTILRGARAGKWEYIGPAAARDRSGAECGGASRSRYVWSAYAPAFEQRRKLEKAMERPGTAASPRDCGAEDLRRVVSNVRSVLATEPDIVAQVTQENRVLRGLLRDLLRAYEEVLYGCDAALL